jgi:hypothetical protein
VRCHRATSILSQDAEIDPSIWAEAQKLALNIAASIPYFLTKNVREFVDQALAFDATPKAMTPGPAVGGLLITHTIYIASNLSVVEPAMKMYLKECLSWIGQNMGIGQAAMLSEVDSMKGAFDWEALLIGLIDYIYESVRVCQAGACSGLGRHAYLKVAIQHVSASPVAYLLF